MNKRTYGLMKRTFTDGQFTVIRKSSWLIAVVIEGPFGERAGQSFSSWLDDLYTLYHTTQYILLDASNIGPIQSRVLQKLISGVFQQEIGGLGILGTDVTRKNFKAMLEFMQDDERIALFYSEGEAVAFLTELYEFTRQQNH